MEIRKAVESDLPFIMEIINGNIKNMHSMGNFQWGDFYPTAEVFTEDISNQTLYIIRDTESYPGIIVLDHQQPPEYADISWPDHNGKFIVVHRLAVNPKFHKQGIARKLMDFAENFARENNYSSVRLDAYSGNPAANALYENRGYQKTGQVYFEHRDLPFNCYEKKF
jgi:ribosomal protein S18 acetylase RimI-like enzyme